MYRNKLPNTPALSNNKARLLRDKDRLFLNKDGLLENKDGLLGSKRLFLEKWVEEVDMFS